MTHRLGTTAIAFTELLKKSKCQNCFCKQLKRFATTFPKTPPTHLVNEQLSATTPPMRGLTNDNELRCELDRLAVIYHYFEVDDEYRDSFLFFLNTGINNKAQYFIYISGPCSVNLPVLPNLEVIYIDNKNFDFGAQYEFSKRNDCLNYNAYIFVNSSMRGPFLPEYYTRDWQLIFTERLKKKLHLLAAW